MTANHSAVRNSYNVDYTNLEIEASKIGTMGKMGAGVGACLETLPAGLEEMYGARDPASDNYGNYQYSDGSIMAWEPVFYYKWGTGTNGLAINEPDIRSVPFSGGAAHRMFYNNGVLQPGVFVDKYLCSNNSGIASSLLNGNPLSSAAAHNPFSGLTGAPANNYGGAIAAAKTRGANFFCCTRFIHAGLALLAYAHGYAATTDTWCAWYDSAGITNYPKGCNNNALGDTDDGSILYTSDGYPNAGKTGSANLFSRTTHNGQNCGVCDLNGNMWEISPGITSNGTNLYLLNTAVKMADVTGGNTLATDLWGATGIAAQYADLGTTFGALWATGVNRTAYYGSATPVFDAATSGNAWGATGAGIPLAGGVGGTNAFGNDGLWDYKPNEMCPIADGSWAEGSNAGVWALALSFARGGSNNSVGFRAALYL